MFGIPTIRRLTRQRVSVAPLLVLQDQEFSLPRPELKWGDLLTREISLFDWTKNGEQFTAVQPLQAEISIRSFKLQSTLKPLAHSIFEHS